MRPPDGFGEVIVAAPAADRVLGSQFAGKDLVGRLRVIIEPPDEPIVNYEGGSYHFQSLLDRFEVLRAFIAKAGYGTGGIFREGLAAGVLAIQDPQGVAVEPSLTGLTELSQPGSKEILQGFLVNGPAGGASYGVDQHLEVGKAQPSEQLQGQLDGFHIQQGVLASYGLEIYLPELAVPPLLGAFIAEHGSGAP